MEPNTGSDYTPTPRDLIFSCAICQITISQLRGRGRIVSSPPTSPYGPVGEILWLTECAHVTCGKHLNNVEQHRTQNNPKAPCPVCSSERNDESLKSLYTIAGFREGEYDQDIPRVWLDVPPTQLDSSGLEMEALRFQYLSLIRYGTMMGRKNHKDAVEIESLNDKLAALKGDCEVFHRENESLRRRVLDLEKQERELERWRAKEKMIVRHLKAVKNVVKENNYLRLQLSRFGYTVPKTDYFAESGQSDVNVSKQEGKVNQLNGLDFDRMQYVKVNQAEHIPSSKGKRGFPSVQEEKEGRLKRSKRHSSRDLMPPPSTSAGLLEEIDALPSNSPWTRNQRPEEDAFRLSPGFRISESRKSQDESLLCSSSNAKGKNKGANLHILEAPTCSGAPKSCTSSYCLPIERYRYTEQKQPTQRRNQYPLYHAKQAANGKLAPLRSHYLHSQDYGTSRNNAIYDTCGLRPRNITELRGHQEVENKRTMPPAAKHFYPNISNAATALPPADKLINRRQSNGTQDVLQTVSSYEGNKRRLGEVSVPSRAHRQMMPSREISVTSPFFKRRSSLPRNYDYLGNSDLHRGNEDAGSDYRRISDHLDSHGLRVLDCNNNDIGTYTAAYSHEPISHPQERGRFEYSLGERMQSEEKRLSLHFMRRPKADLPTSNASYLSRDKELYRHNVTPMTPFATQGLVTPRSFPLTPKPRSYLSREGSSRRNFALFRPSRPRNLNKS